MEHVVLETFKERFDHNRIYEEGKPYPQGDYEPTDERIEELSTKNNSYKRPFIGPKKADKKPATKAKSKEVKSKVADKDAKG